MKKAFAIFTAVVLMPASQSWAWIGGPFSNNTHLPSGDDGIYEATASMSNGVGIFRFAVSNNGLTGSGVSPGTQLLESSNVQFNGGIVSAHSSNVWYYKGITYYGVTFGSVNSDAGIVSAVGNASTNTPGVDTSFNDQPDVALNGLIINNPRGNNIGYANSSFIANIDDKGPVVRFSGKGDVSFVGEANFELTVEALNPVRLSTTANPDEGPEIEVVDGIGPAVTPNEITTVTTIPGGIGTPPIVITTTNTPTEIDDAIGNSTTSGFVQDVAAITTSPSGSTTTATNNLGLDGGRNITFKSSNKVSTGGEDSEFSQRGHVRSFVVFGSRVSTTVAP